MFDIQAQESCNKFFEKLTQEWLNCVKIRVKESTFSRYCNQINKYILPSFGKYQVSKISTELIECFVNKLIGEKENGGYNLSHKTAQDILIVTKNILKFGNIHTHLDLSRIKIKKSDNKPCIFSKADQKGKITINNLWGLMSILL